MRALSGHWKENNFVKSEGQPVSFPPSFSDSVFIEPIGFLPFERMRRYSSERVQRLRFDTHRQRHRKSHVDPIRKFIYVDRDRKERLSGDGERERRQLVHYAGGRWNAVRQPDSDDDLHGDSKRQWRQDVGHNDGNGVVGREPSAYREHHS